MVLYVDLSRARWKSSGTPQHSTASKIDLNYLMILSAYRHRLDEMNLTKVASIFVQKNDCRWYTSGKFEFCWFGIFKIVYSPLEYFCKFIFMVEKRKKKKKQASLKSQKARIFQNRPPGEIPSLSLCNNMNNDMTLKSNLQLNSMISLMQFKILPIMTLLRTAKNFVSTKLLTLSLARPQRTSFNNKTR